MMFYIYKATNLLNQKSYIGFTENPDRRWNQHCNDYRRYNRPFYNAMKKYGPENFHFEIIYENEDRQATLVQMEPFFIELYDTYRYGYNCTKGGANTNTPEMCKRTSERMK
jgi:group I intron endonuclease